MSIRIFGFMMLFAGVVLSAMALAQSAPEPKSEEYLLLGSPNRGAGEPWVFVNPKDPNNIIVVAMATLNRLPSGETPIPRTTPFTPGVPMPPDPARTSLRIKELSTPDGSLTSVAVTQDGGKTWSFSEDDLRKIYDKN